MSEDINKKSLVDKKIHEQDVSVYAYDRAIVEDFRARFKNTKNNEINPNVQIGPADRMFNILGQLDDDKVVLPFISLQRTDWQLNLDRPGYQTFIGEKVFKRVNENNQIIEVRAQVIPITINYQLSVWSKDQVTNDALVREFLFYYHLRPSLLVYVGHGLNIAHKFNIYFNSGIENNSDIANHINRGVYFRQDLSFYTDDAYLWRANYQNVVKIDPNINFYYDDLSKFNVSYKDLIEEENNPNLN